MKKNDLDYQGKFDSFICPNPFVYAEIQKDGNITTCCYLTHKFGTLKEQSISDIWNNDDLQELRRSVIEGDYSYCDARKCASMQRVLQSENKTFQYQIPYELIKKEDAIELIEKFATKEEFSAPQIISLEDDPSCNLSCPSCRQSLNILSTGESKKTHELQISLLDSMGTELQELWLCGAGDPLAAPSYRDLLSQYDFNKLPNVKIRLDSNGVLFNEHAWETVLKNVQDKIDLIAISVDATTKESYGLIRRGGNFETLMKNLQFISSLRQNGFKFVYIIRMIVQKNNFEQMQDFVRLGISLNVDSVVFSVIQNWGTFSHEEYLQNAVHLAGHEDHKHLCTILKDKLFDDPRVDMGNLSELYRKIKNV